jgi:predicted ArsR family transcriptional regulator
MPQPDFTMEELLVALQQQPATDGEGVSARELSEQLGRSRQWVLSHLGALARQGKLDKPQFRVGIGIDGRTIRTPLYRLKRPVEGQEGSKS